MSLSIHKKEHNQRAYKISGDKNITGEDLNSILWVLFHSDSKTSIQDISEKTKIPLEKFKEIVKTLEKVKLIKKIRK